MTVHVVTGTDTGVGKTVATAALTAALTASGRSVAVYKPVQAGTEDGEGDVDVVRRLTGHAHVHEGIRLPYPMAPVAAAARAGLRLPPVDAHADTVRELAARHDDVLVEGAGGLLVALDEDGHTLADLALRTGAAAVAVCRAGLGTLNHTALTLEALAHRGIPVAGLVIGAWPAEPTDVETSNRRHLTALPHAFLGALPAGAPHSPHFRAHAPTWLTPVQPSVVLGGTRTARISRRPRR
jgi:dethiobiotin synthetase